MRPSSTDDRTISTARTAQLFLIRKLMTASSVEVLHGSVVRMTLGRE